MAANFASVKLPAALVQLARASAQPLRRSVAGQIEYWATLGRVAEQSGLSALEARAAIEAFEAAVPTITVPAAVVSAIPDMGAAPEPSPVPVAPQAQPFIETPAASTLAQRIRSTMSDFDPDTNPDIDPRAEAGTTEREPR